MFFGRGESQHNWEDISRHFMMLGIDPRRHENKKNKKKQLTDAPMLALVARQFIFAHWNKKDCTVSHFQVLLTTSSTYLRENNTKRLAMVYPQN